MPKWSKQDRAQSGPVIEVSVDYDPDQDPAFSLQLIRPRHGHAPTPMPADPGQYALVLIQGSQVVLTAELAAPMVCAPPPRKGEPVGKLPKPGKERLLVTLPWADRADELRLIAPDGVLLERHRLGKPPKAHPIPTAHQTRRGDA